MILSAARKELLVKKVTLTIPTYTLNCFLLPKYFCDDLNKLLASFWWNDCDGEKNPLDVVGEAMYTKN